MRRRFLFILVICFGLLAACAAGEDADRHQSQLSSAAESLTDEGAANGLAVGPKTPAAEGTAAAEDHAEKDASSASPSADQTIGQPASSAIKSGAKEVQGADEPASDGGAKAGARKQGLSASPADPNEPALPDDNRKTDTAAAKPDVSGQAAASTGNRSGSDDETPDPAGGGMSGGGMGTVSPPASRDSSPQQGQDIREPEQQTVVLSIHGEGEIGVILEPVAVRLEEGDTVLDVLKRVTREKRIPMEYRGAGPLAYVEGIADIYEFDYGPQSGWLYLINGEQPNQSAGSRSLEPGDVVEWIYVIEDGDDE